MYLLELANICRLKDIILRIYIYIYIYIYLFIYFRTRLPEHTNFIIIIFLKTDM